MTRRGLSWLIPVQLGMSFMAGGVFMIAQGMAARQQVRQMLEDEQITSAQDSLYAGQPVVDVKTALAQVDVIKAHSLKETEGRTFAQLPREDPLRAHYLDGVVLRTSLGLSVMGLRVSELVMGMGAFMAATGVALIVLAPASGQTAEE